MITPNDDIQPLPEDRAKALEFLGKMSKEELWAWFQASNCKSNQSLYTRPPRGFIASLTVLCRDRRVATTLIPQLWKIEDFCPIRRYIRDQILEHGGVGFSITFEAQAIWFKEEKRCLVSFYDHGQFGNKSWLAPIEKPYQELGTWIEGENDSQFCGPFTGIFNTIN